MTTKPPGQQHHFPSYDKHFGGSFFSYQKKQYLEALLLVRCQEVAVDAGAHVGIFSDRMVKNFKHVHSFEPDPLNFKCLKKNVGHHPNITLHNKALSDAAGTCETVRGQVDNSGDVSIDITRGEIPRITLDSLHLQDVGFIKVDTQGHETPIILGARDTIQKCKPILLIELPTKELVNILDSWGYALIFKHMKDCAFQPKEFACEP